MSKKAKTNKIISQILIIGVISLVLGYVLGSRPYGCGMWDGHNPNLPGKGINTGGIVYCFGLLRLFNATQSTFTKEMLSSVGVHSLVIFIILFVIYKLYFFFTKRGSTYR